jgi:hypothetical protein
MRRAIRAAGETKPMIRRLILQGIGEKVAQLLAVCSPRSFFQMANRSPFRALFRW